MHYRIYDREEERYLMNYEGHIEQTGLVISELNAKASDIQKRINPNIQNRYLVELGIILSSNDEDEYMQVFHEGDIVKCEALCFLEEAFNNLIGKVVFKEGAFYIEFEDQMFKLWNEGIKYELIGNIHSKDKPKLSNYYRAETLYEEFVQKMLDTPNDKFNISVRDSITNWELELDDYGIFKIIKDNRDSSIKLWFTVDGVGKTEKVNNDINNFFEKWDEKYKKHLREEEEKFEEKAILKLEDYLYRQW